MRDNSALITELIALKDRNVRIFDSDHDQKSKIFDESR